MIGTHDDCPTVGSGSVEEPGHRTEIIQLVSRSKVAPFELVIDGVDHHGDDG
jgi:hypothetical protein